MTDERLPTLRASDADRERVAGILRDAVAEGRLDMGEFEERLDAAYRARTYGELAPLTADLPAAAPAAPALSLRKDPAPGGAPTPWSARIRDDAPGETTGIAVLSGFERKGRWTIGRRFTAVCCLGGGEIDLRDADFAARDVEIAIWAVLGGVTVIVPPGVEVVSRGAGVMGSFDTGEDATPADPGAPRVTLSGMALMGGVEVRRRLPKEEWRRLKAERKEEKRRLRHERRGRRELD
ncbi:hypothetical protein ADL22_26220 [Streptomyces sp. NRRL F-4489]|uniref:DUF1707 SHOCT-like domain-containing protein n=1 Tax=Streptomyces sp. NRRL F-4489 TaxID=1609095 RepID=UPI00074693CF|nr:DUF1707 domain-containing protein [Streptomyces sp. NRRL F-4489]KUL35701.1 hypothetical protein ADL22_26220 [Streptomyces sp. NRRL F-4489]